LISGVETAVEQLEGKIVTTPYSTTSDHDSFATLRFPRLLISWRLAGDDNLPDHAAHKVDSENIQFAGQSAALLLMSLAQ